MKQTLFIIAIVFSTFFASAQKPEPIYGFAIVRKSTDYYKQQASLWKKELDKNKHNANAWYNYYRVNRNLINADTSDKRDWITKQKSQSDLVDEMQKEIPNTYEYNLCRWLVSGFELSKKQHLLDAADLAKNQTAHYTDMVSYYEVERDIERRNFYAKKLSESTEASPGMMNYNYNVLMSLNQNAVILTCGDNDTYPLWELQAKGIRTDVMVLNLSLLTIDVYRDKIFKELGIENLNTEETKEWQKNYLSSFLIKHICLKSYKRTVFLGLTVDLNDAKSIQDSLYLIGLAYKYSTENIDNMAAMRKNFEQHYALDYLEQHFYNDISGDLVIEINTNYIVPMIKLFDHYKKSGEEEKANWIWAKLRAVGEGKNLQKTLEELFKKK